MNCQWRPLNHNYPSSSSSLSSAQSLHEQFSRLSVNPETSTFLNLDRPSTSTTNTALDHQFHINQLRSYAAAQAHEITNFSGSSGLGLGSNSGLGSDFSVSSSPYPSFPRNFMNDLESSQGLYGYYSNVSHNGYYDTGLDSRLFSNNSNNGHHHNNYNGLNPRLPTHNSIINGLDQNYHQCNNYDTGLSPGYSNLYQADYNKDLRRLTSARNHNQSLLSLVWSERMRGEVVRLVKDKDSSQFLIKKFQAGHMEGVKIIVAEIEECIVEVLCDQTGSQFVQKLLKHLDFQDVHVLLKATLANVGICFDNQGTRAAQEILKYADKNNNEVQNIIVKAIRNVFRFANGCQNAYHFIEAVLHAFQEVYEVIQPLMSEAADLCVDIAMDKVGCCKLQQIIRYGQGPERGRIIETIISHALELSEDAYGNYVVQFIVAQEDEPNITVQVIKRLKGYFVDLSKNKFGSHVVQKCMKAADDEHAELIIKEISDPAIFLDMCQHPYSNFVVQTALEVAKIMHVSRRSTIYQLLVCRIHDNYAFLNSHMFGKRVLAQLTKLLKSRVLF